MVRDTNFIILPPLDAGAAAEADTPKDPNMFAGGVVAPCNRQNKLGISTKMFYNKLHIY